MHHSHPGKIFNLIKGKFVILNDFFLNCTNPHKKRHGFHRFYVVFAQPESAADHDLVNPLPLTVDNDTARDEQLVLDGRDFIKLIQPLQIIINEYALNLFSNSSGERIQQRIASSRFCAAVRAQWRLYWVNRCRFGESEVFNWRTEHRQFR